jgi:hypothetical protein
MTSTPKDNNNCMNPVRKKELLTNLIIIACRDFKISDEHIEYFTQGVKDAVEAFEKFPPQDREELDAFKQMYNDAKAALTSPPPYEDIPIYAGYAANYSLALLACIEHPSKYVPKDFSIERILNSGKEDLN